MYLDGAGLVGQATSCPAAEFLVGEFIHHCFEQTWLEHVKGDTIALENRHWAVICPP